MRMRFWQLSEAGDVRAYKRWIVKPSWSFITAERLAVAKAVSDWDGDRAVVECEKTEVHEDMPCPVDGSTIISDRLRVFFERETPGDAQYLPVRMIGDGANGLRQQYWAVNWLRMFECLDKARSYNEDDEPDRPFVEIPVIDPSWIPPDGVVGRIKEYDVVVIIRGDLKAKINREGFLGPQFYRIWHSDDEGAPPPIWKPGVRRR